MRNIVIASTIASGLSGCFSGGMSGSAVHPPLPEASAFEQLGDLAQVAFNEIGPWDDPHIAALNHDEIPTSGRVEYVSAALFAMTNQAPPGFDELLDQSTWRAAHLLELDFEAESARSTFTNFQNTNGEAFVGTIYTEVFNASPNTDGQVSLVHIGDLMNQAGQSVPVELNSASTLYGTGASHQITEVTGTIGTEPIAGRSYGGVRVR